MTLRQGLPLSRRTASGNVLIAQSGRGSNSRWWNPRGFHHRLLGRQRTATAHPAINLDSWDPGPRIIPGDGRPEGDSAGQPPAMAPTSIGGRVSFRVSLSTLWTSETRGQRHGTWSRASGTSPRTHRRADPFSGLPPPEQVADRAGGYPAGAPCANRALPGDACCRSGSSVPASRRSPRSPR